MSEQAVKKAAEKATDANPTQVRALVFPRDMAPAAVVEEFVKVKKAAGDKASPLDGHSRTKTMPDDPWSQYQSDLSIVEPPLPQLELAVIPEMNDMLGPAIETMAVNVAGYGQRVKCRLNKKQREGVQGLDAERLRLENFLGGCCYVDSYSFTTLRRDARTERESTGNSYIEVIRDAADEPDGLHLISSHSMRITVEDKDFTELEQWRLVKTEKGWDLKKQRVFKRFRRFVQLAAGQFRFFKELGDPRCIKASTGGVATKEEQENWNHQGVPMPDIEKANEVLHQRLYCTRSPYGLPRWVGALLSVTGSRKSEEVNFATLANNQVPSLAMLISNGQLTTASIERVTEFVEQVIQGSDNRSKFLILEAEGNLEGPDAGNVKFEVKPLTESQHTDAMFQDYQKQAGLRVRRQFRLPPIFFGDTDDYNRATAEIGRRLTDEQVFHPERLVEDETWNRRLFIEVMGFRYYYIETNTPNVTNDADLLMAIKEAERTGAMTPRLAKAMLEDILGKELDEMFPIEGIDLDTPYSLQMADRVKNQAKPNEVGQQFTAMKALGVPMPPGFEDAVDYSSMVLAGLAGLRDRMDDIVEKRLSMRDPSATDDPDA